MFTFSRNVTMHASFLGGTTMQEFVKYRIVGKPHFTYTDETYYISNIMKHLNNKPESPLPNYVDLEPYTCALVNE